MCSEVVVVVTTAAAAAAAAAAAHAVRRHAPTSRSGKKTRGLGKNDDVASIANHVAGPEGICMALALARTSSRSSPRPVQTAPVQSSLSPV